MEFRKHPDAHQEPEENKHLLALEREEHRKIYEFYWGVALKISAYFYTLSGALGAFYVSNHSKPQLASVLIVPVVSGCTLATSF